MGFFDELNAVCEAQNAHLDQLLEQQRQEAAVAKQKEEEENKLKRRNWAVGVLEEGKMPLGQRDKITAAMMIVVTDHGITCSEVERLLLKQEVYRPVIYQSLIEKFLDRGGDPAGDLGMFCVKQGLSVAPGTNLFKDGPACEALGMSLLVLGRFNQTKRPEISAAYQLLRKLFPFTKNGNLQNIPHKLGEKLYPEKYEEGRCIHHFTSRDDTGEARRVVTKPRRYRSEEKPEDPEIKAAVEDAANGKFSGIRLIRAS